MKKQEQSEPRASLGLRLRKERELRGISLEEVSSVTRVRLVYLRHLEEDGFESLPADVYVRGYIRSYARFLGIDAERCIEQYSLQSPAKHVGPVAAFDGDLGTITTPALPSLSDSPADATTTAGVAMGVRSSGGRSRMGLALAIVLLFIAALLIFGVYYVNRSGDAESNSNNKPSTTETATFDVAG
ncbi:MAG: helix-turn-helix domain-containing protein [bacterium]